MIRSKLLLLAVAAATVMLGQESATRLYEQSLQAATPEDAVKLLRMSLAAGASFEAHYQLGVNYNKLRHFEESLAELREAFLLTSPEQLKDRAHVLFRRAEATEGLGNPLAAKQLLEMSLNYEDHPAVRAKLIELQDRLAQAVLEAAVLKGAIEQATKDLKFERDETAGPAVDVWLTFEAGRTDLTPKGREQAEKLAEALLSPAAQGYRFRLIGHTDRTGSDEINVPLSLERARRVRAFLLSKGMAESRVMAEGRGSKEPLRAGNSAADYAVNRRVQVVLVPMK